MNLWAWIGGGAALGALAAGWDKIKSVVLRIISLVIMTVKVQGVAARAVSLYCWTNLDRSKWGERYYSGSRIFIRSLRRTRVVAFEEVGYTSIIFWRGWRPILIGLPETNKDKPGLNWDSVTLTFPRWLWDVDALIQDAVDAYNAHHDRGLRSARFRVLRRIGMGSVHARMSGGQNAGAPVADECGDFTLGDKRILRWSPDDLGADSGVVGRLLSGLAFPEDVLAAIQEAQRWQASETWFRERQIPWRWGWLLYGKPGTGKSALVRAIGQELDLPIYSFDLASMSNAELVSEWTHMLSSSPCLALFEDIDAVFDGRRNTLGEMGGGLTFDCFLNCLSGVEGCDGVFSVVTTNRIERLDLALGIPDESRGHISSRPGRIDRVLHLQDMNEPCRRRIAERVFQGNGEYVNAVIAEGSGDTPAQFVNRCTQRAMEQFKSNAP